MDRPVVKSYTRARAAHPGGPVRPRVLFLSGLAVGVFALLAVRLFALQVLQGPAFRSMAREVARRELPIFARRGEIFDRHYGAPLVTNVSTYAIDVIPGYVPRDRRAVVMGALAKALEIEPGRLEALIPPEDWELNRPVELKGDVPFERIAWLAERIDDYPGLTWRVKPLRSYQEAGSIAHVIGYVGDLTREEYQVNYGKGYSLGSVIGKSGVEKSYDETLRGRDGRRFYVADAFGLNLADLDEEVVSPVPGSDIVLTIDARIQRLAERALGRRTGSVVVLQPATGEVLAMVSYPTFDANVFYTSEGSRSVSALSLDPGSPFINRAIEASYPPASVFKIVDSAALIGERPFPLDTVINSVGYMVYGGRVWWDHVKTGHGPLTFMAALAESCNIYFWTVGLEVGVNALVRYSEELGLGRRSGIDLPGEVAGLVPDPSWKKRTRHTDWFGGDTMNMAIGHGDLAATPLQMANLLAMVVNDGVLYRPHVVREIRDPETGEIIETMRPEVIRRADIPPEVYPLLKEGLRGVVARGTPRTVITTEAVQVAGKTGTGELGGGENGTNLKNFWHSWFVAYGPYIADDPTERVVVAVLVEASDNWEWWAPKAANVIFQGIFADQSFDEAISALNAPWLYPEAAIR